MCDHTLELENILSNTNHKFFCRNSIELEKHFKTLTIRELNNLAYECDQLALKNKHDNILFTLYSKDIRSLIESEAMRKYREVHNEL